LGRDSNPRVNVGFSFGDSIWGVIALLIVLGFLAVGVGWVTGNSSASFLGALLMGIGIVILIVVIVLAATQAS
jgi:hypothetical protein